MMYRFLYVYLWFIVFEDIIHLIYTQYFFAMPSRCRGKMSSLGLVLCHS